MRTTGYLTSDPGRHVTAVIPYKVVSRPQVIIIVSPPSLLVPERGAIHCFGGTGELKYNCFLGQQ